MPRRRRTGSGGVIFHVINRGAKRARLFDQSLDYQAFEKLLTEYRERVQIPLLAYCLMPNHWHLVVWPERDGDLSRFMHLLTSTHAQRWNAQRGLSGVGAVYQGRFKAIPIQRDHHFLRVCRYVERNPLRAGLVPMAEEWRWSSLWRRTHFCDQVLLSPWPVPIQENWADFLQQGSAQIEVEKIRYAIRRSQPFGADGWRAETAKRLGLEPSLRRRGRPDKEGAETPPDPFFRCSVRSDHR